MNRNFRSIWNEATGTFVAVSENTKNHGKRTTSGTHTVGDGQRLSLQTISVCVALCFGVNAYAGPTGGVVAAGSATINFGAKTTTINQSSQNAVINWQSFNIAADQAVIFVQPNSNSVALNRVLGNDPSAIFGSLSANGKVFLVNPNGVLFGKGAQVSVGGLVASTLNISDHDFMAGKYLFSGDSTAQVQNLGNINADGGYVALLGASVDNQGVISARLGTVALAAGSAMTLDVAGDGLLNVTVNQGTVNALAQNGGLIQADGGNVLLTAKAAGTLLQSAVNNTGMIQAQTIENHNGTIRLMGDMQIGTVNVGGKLDASAPNGGDGGFIETSAAHVKVADGARITTFATSGKTGTWLVDPLDYNVAAAGGDITGTALGTQLDLTNVTLQSSAGSTGTFGNVNINDAVSWTQTTTLTLNAVNDVNIAAAVTGINGSVTATAGNDVNVSAATKTTTGMLTFKAVNDVAISAATTITTGNLTAVAGRDVKVSAVSTVTTGDMIFRADNDGNGPGVAAGTVAITCGLNCLTITTGNLRIRFNPVSYGTTGAEITAYGGHLTGAGVLDAKAWVFGKGDNKIYDGTTVATVTGLKPDTSNVQSGAVLGVVSNANFDTKDVGVNKPITYNTVFSNAVFDLFSTYGTAPGTYGTQANITPAPLTITANPASKAYNGTPYTGGNGVTYAAFVGGETAADLGGTLSYGGSSQGAVNTGSYTITPAGQSSSNYAITYASGALTVSPAALTVTASDVSKAYGQVPTLSAFTSAGLLGGDTIGSVTETSPGTVSTAAVAGSPYVITPSGATGGTFVPGNYTITYVNGVLTVIPVPLTITANDASKSYGTAVTLPVTAFTSTGLVNGETLTSVTETSPGTVATAPVVGSPYVITPSGATGSFVPTNYTISYVNGVLAVIPVPLTITANDVSKSYGTAITLPVTAFTSTGLANGDTVTSVTETSPGTVATAPVVGSPYAITPSGAAGSFVPTNYTIAYVNGVLTVIPVPLTITANDASKSYGTAITLPVTAFTSTSLVNGETVTSVTETSPGTVATAPVAGSPYAITPSGATGSFVPTNYTIAYVDGALTVNPIVGLPPVVEPPVVVPPKPPVVIVPGVLPTVLPPQLQTLVPPIVPAPVVVANSVVLDELIPPIKPPVEGGTGAVGNVVDEKYPLVAPHRPRKQDRN